MVYRDGKVTGSPLLIAAPVLPDEYPGWCVRVRYSDRFGDERAAWPATD